VSPLTNNHQNRIINAEYFAGIKLREISALSLHPISEYTLHIHNCVFDETLACCRNTIISLVFLLMRRKMRINWLPIL